LKALWVNKIFSLLIPVGLLQKVHNFGIKNPKVLTPHPL
jgi:hypothetical protein